MISVQVVMGLNMMLVILSWVIKLCRLLNGVLTHEVVSLVKESSSQSRQL